MIPGNHEWYQKEDASQSFNLDLAIYPNVKYINHQKIHIDGVDFFFTTLWSRIGSSLINNYIADFRRCKYGTESYKHNHHDELHRESVEWLNRELKEKKTHPRVVVSHFVPCPEVDGYPESKDDYIRPIIKRYFVAGLSDRIDN